MVARLVFDAIWRNRWLYSMVVVMLLPFWLAFAVSGSNPLPIITSLSLSFAVVLGPMAVIATMGLRELRHLPVTNRDLWRATWVVGTVVAAGVLLVAKTVSALLVAAFGGSPTVSAEAILLSTVYDFTWAGTVLPLFPLLGHAGHAVAHRGTLAASCAAAAPTAAVLAGFGLPILVSDALPTRLGEFTSATTGVLVAGLAIAFGALAWTPERGVLAGERAQARRAFVSPGSCDSDTSHRSPDWNLAGGRSVPVDDVCVTSRRVSRAGSLRRHLWNWPVVVRATRTDGVRPGGHRGPRTDLLRLAALCGRDHAGPLDTMGAFAEGAALVGKTNQRAASPHSLRGLDDPVAPRVVRLRLRVRDSPNVESRLGVRLGWDWRPRARRPPPISGQPAAIWVFVSIGGLMPQLLKVGLRDGTDPQIVFAVIGAIALCAAAFVNHHTLTRSTSSSRAYQRPQPPFGFPAKTGIR